MKNLVMAAILGLLLFGTNAPTEAATHELAFGSQVELVEVMHHPPQHGGHGGWYAGHGGRGGRGGLKPPPPPPRKGWGNGRGGHGPHGPHFPGGRRW